MKDRVLVGTLYLVATPIGNLEDISPRALRILREVRLIAAEDTRQTRKLLSHFDIHTRTLSYHAHSFPARLKQILAVLEQGDVALVSDAGTPALNDPGYELVRAALERGFPVSPIPGPAAPIAALVASGLPTDTFLYLGYLPHKASERRRLLARVASEPYTLILLETPHRLAAALRDLQEVLGNRQIAVARELTKLHEEIFRGDIAAARARFAESQVFGEITLVVAGSRPAGERWSEAQLDQAIEEMLAQQHPPTRIAARLATSSGWPRRQIYRRVMEKPAHSKATRN